MEETWEHSTRTNLLKNDWDADAGNWWQKTKWSGYMIKGDKISAKLEIIGMAYLCIHVLVYVRSGLECSKGDNAIQWIKLYPLDSAVCFANTYPLDSDLFFG